MQVRGKRLHQSNISWKSEWEKRKWIFEFKLDYTTISQLNEAECELKLRRYIDINTWKKPK